MIWEGYMELMRLSKLLMAWLFANGHEFIDVQEGIGMTTQKDGKIWKFDLSGNYGGMQVKFKNMVFYFYRDGKLLTQTDLNEFT